MSIAAPTKPEVIVHGIVMRSREITRKESGEVLGENLLVEGEKGALYVTAWESAHASLNVGDTVSIWAAVDEGARGSQLSYVREVTPDDLAKLEATFKVLSGK